MSMVKIIQTKFNSQRNLRDIIEKYEEIDPEFAKFLRQQDFTELTKFCMEKAVELMLQNNQDLCKEQGGLRNVSFPAVIKSSDFSSRLTIKINLDGMIFFTYNERQNQKGVEKIKKAFISAFQAVYLENIFKILSPGAQVKEMECRNGKYRILLEEV